MPGKSFARLRRLFHRRNRRQRPLTLEGRFLLIAAVICLHGLLDSTILPLLAYVLGILTVAGFASWYYKPRLRGHVVPTGLICQGDPLDVRVRLTNLRSVSAYDLHVEMIDIPDGWSLTTSEQLVGALAPGESIELQYAARGVRRGEFRLPRVRTYSTFPFNLFCRTQILRSGGVSVIAPALDDHRLDTNRQRQGIESTEIDGRRRASSALEYIGSREYQPGTPVRRWDFTSWARLGTPTVCEYVEGMHRRAILLVDLQKIPANTHGLLSPDDCFEALLSRAATVVDFLVRSDFELQMYLLGNDLTLVQGDDGLSVRDQMLGALARCETVSKIGASTVDESYVRSATSEIFAVFSRWDLQRQSIVESLDVDPAMATIELVPEDFTEADAAARWQTAGQLSEGVS